MTIPAKYTLTEAHFVIVELEKKIKLLERELNVKNDEWPCGCKKGEAAHGIGWSDCAGIR